MHTLHILFYICLAVPAYSLLTDQGVNIGNLWQLTSTLTSGNAISQSHQPTNPSHALSFNAVVPTADGQNNTIKPTGTGMPSMPISSGLATLLQLSGVNSATIVPAWIVYACFVSMIVSCR
ncbi:hypothetical protein F5Y16DRAFT_201855 [Xylariaceae sp. FL0255]|nr:hypothetical protein F5Y16DRAFT_201855 [Xylariaceae sp. FL0255]